MTWLMENLLPTIVLIFLYISLGHLASRLLWRDVDQISAKSQVVASFYIGIGIWFLIATALGLTGHFTDIYVASIAVVICLISILPVFRALKKSTHIVSDEFRQVIPQGKAWKLLFVLSLLLVIGGAAGVGNSALEDGAAFYLPIAKATAYSGWLEKLPGYEGFSAVGLVGELQMATLFLFHAEDAARMMSWICFLPIFFILFDFAKKMQLSAKATVVLLVCVFSSSAVFYITGGGKVDLFAAALGFVGIYFLFFEDEDWLSALLLAFACLAKLSLFIPFFPVILTGLYLRTCKSQLGTSKLKNFFFRNVKYACIFAAVMTPHLIKNYVFFKNPWAPFYGSEFGWETSWYSQATTSRIIFTYPLVWFYGNYWAQLGTLALPVLMFLPFYFSRKALQVKNWIAQDYLLASLIMGMLLWLLIRPSFVAPRYILAVLLGFSLFAAAGFDRWLSRNFRAPKKKFIALALLVLWCLHSLTFMQKTGSSVRKAYAYLSGEMPYCARDAYHCFVAQELNAVVPPGARILQLSYFTLWLRGDLLQTMRQTDEAQIKLGPITEEAWRLIYQHDFQYVYLDRVSHREMIKTYFIDKLPPWVTLQPIAELQAVSAYKIIFADSVKFKKKRKVVADGNHWTVVNIE